MSGKIGEICCQQHQRHGDLMTKNDKDWKLPRGCYQQATWCEETTTCTVLYCAWLFPGGFQSWTILTRYMIAVYLEVICGLAVAVSGVWRFGEEAGVQKVLTSSLSHFGYVLHFGEQTWRKVHHPNLTLAEAGVKDGDTIRFTGDFEPK